MCRLAETIFEFNGEVSDEPVDILIEALRCAGHDFCMLADYDAADPMAHARAGYRCDLACMLFDYRSRFGYPSAKETEVSP